MNLKVLDVKIQINMNFGKVKRAYITTEVPPKS